MSSLLPVRVTVVQEPLNPVQAPPASGEESRSTTSLARSRPEPVSVPKSIVSGTEVVVYQGPPESAAVAPVGAAVSLVTVNVPVAVPPAPLVAVTVWLPEAVVVLSQV